MPGPTASLLALALLGASLAIASCGEDDAELLPGGTAREITANLDAVERLADEGDCAGAESAALQVSEQVEALEGVDPRLKRALERGAARLEEVVAGCEEEAEAVVPEVTESEFGPDEETEEKEREKEREEEEKAEVKEEKAEEKEEAEPEDEPSLPPQAEGEGKGLEEEGDSGPGGGEGGGSPSGGLGPGNPATGEGD